MPFESNIYNMKDLDFVIGVQMHRDYSGVYEYLLDPSYFNIGFYTTNVKLESTGGPVVETNVNQIPLVRCGDRFASAMKEFSDILNLQTVL